MEILGKGSQGNTERKKLGERKRDHSGPSVAYSCGIVK
jgi:hypothetical protein